MAFLIENYDELMALHRVVMEAKFSVEPNDPVIQGSPFVSTIANQVVEALIEMEVEKEGETSRLKWQEWRKLSPERREYQIIQAKLKSNTSWKTWNFDQQVKYVKDLASPLQVADELISNFLN
ncbi:MAG: hypothetical protein HC824_09260 [Synechococcales cyanobacterium RM1_1_8]|nr:hypothetical protein [Synechococcales cyanobacterium RM1_1_8]